MARAMLISVGFTAGVYRGADRGRPEELPSPARLHAALVSAAGGGPAASPEGGLLVADPMDRDALLWLESNMPIGMRVPHVMATDYQARRHRVRVAVDVERQHDHHRDETNFEPFSALNGPVVFAWPPAPTQIVERLASLAHEVTHVGEADSTVVVHVWNGELDANDGDTLLLSEGRGPGRELRVPTAGRTEALVDAYEKSLEHSSAVDGPGLKSRQAVDSPAGSAREQATELRRFAPTLPDGPWPYREAWTVPIRGAVSAWDLLPQNVVRTAVQVHRALVAEIGDDVPEFVSGRSGDRPLAGAGHLAIQLVPQQAESETQVVLGVPTGVSEADRAILFEALTRSPIVKLGKRWNSGWDSDQRNVKQAALKRRIARLDVPSIGSGLRFWHQSSTTFATASPIVLDAPGTPRRGPWSLDDAVLCSLGYALRGVLEERGFEWGSGWEFRQRVVSTLRESGADARAFRVASGASRFLHHASEGDLLVAVHAVVKLGNLASGGRGLLALGRARHLGGGLLVPLSEAA